MSKILDEVLSANGKYAASFGGKSGRLTEVPAATTAGKAKAT